MSVRFFFFVPLAAYAYRDTARDKIFWYFREKVGLKPCIHIHSQS